MVVLELMCEIPRYFLNLIEKIDFLLSVVLLSAVLLSVAYKGHHC